MVWEIDFLARVLLPTSLNGLVFGISISLLAIGLTLVFGIMSVINFSHGEMFMIAGWVAFITVSWTKSFWLGLVASIIVVSVLGLGIERLLVRRIYAKEHGVLLILVLTFGLALVIRESVRPFAVRTTTVQDPIGLSITLMTEPYPVYNLLIIFIGVSTYAVLWFFINRTRLGSITRAASEDSEMLSCLGVDVRRVFSWTFTLGAGLAALAGVIMTPVWSVTVDIGITMILWAFIVIIAGGMGSVGGSIIASIIFGQILALGSIWLEPREIEILIFGILIVILLVRPRGLFGKPGVLD